MLERQWTMVIARCIGMRFWQALVQDYRQVGDCILHRTCDIVRIIQNLLLNGQVAYSKIESTGYFPRRPRAGECMADRSREPLACAEHGLAWLVFHVSEGVAREENLTETFLWRDRANEFDVLYFRAGKRVQCSNSRLVAVGEDVSKEQACVRMT